MWYYFVIFVTVNQDFIHYDRIQNTCLWAHGTGALYSPTLTDIAAYRKMKKWISLCPGLLQRLYDLGYESKRRSFTPLEVRVIVDALGEP